MIQRRIILPYGQPTLLYFEIIELAKISTFN